MNFIDKMYTKFNNPNISYENFRTYLVSMYLYFMCIFIHAGLLFLFYFIGVYEMAIFNIFSVSIFVLNVILNYKGKLEIAYILAISEILIHACFATLFIGWDSNFPVYTVSLIVVNIFCSSKKPTSRLFFPLLSIIANSIVYLTVTFKSPIYSIDKSVLSVVGLVNLATISLAIVSVCFIFLVITEKLKVDYSKSEKLLNENSNLLTTLQKNILDLKNFSSNISSNVKYSNVNINSISNSIDNINNSSNNNLEFSEKILLNSKKAAELSNEISITSNNIQSFNKKILLAATEGQILIRKTSNSINIVAENSIQILDKIKILKESSIEIEKIYKITKNLIKEIQILSVNTAIESGRNTSTDNGFIIISKEISKLAIKSKNTTINLSNIVENISNQIGELYNFIDENLIQVNNCVLNSNNENTKFITILNLIEKMSENINEIALSTKTQSVLSNEIEKEIQNSFESSQLITKNISEITVETKNHLRSLRSLENVSENLNSQADLLQTTVSK